MLGLVKKFREELNKPFTKISSTSESSAFNFQSLVDNLKNQWANVQPNFANQYEISKP